MKSSDPSLSYFSMYPVNSQEQSQTAQRQSPYLKAILSAKMEETGRIVTMAISDKLAAIRYIRESNWRNGLSRV